MSRKEKALELRKKANELIEERIPQMWKNGDVRFIESTIYRQIRALLDEAVDLEVGEGSYLFRSSKIVYKGPFGELKIEEAV